LPRKQVAKSILSTTNQLRQPTSKFFALVAPQSQAIAQVCRQLDININSKIVQKSQLIQNGHVWKSSTLRPLTCELIKYGNFFTRFSRSELAPNLEYHRIRHHS
jgi:hypothetical protein